VVKDSLLRERYAVSLGNRFPTFRWKAVPPSSRVYRSENSRQLYPVKQSHNSEGRNPREGGDMRLIVEGGVVGLSIFDQRAVFGSSEVGRIVKLK
jgi:hypothetical protein